MKLSRKWVSVFVSLIILIAGIAAPHMLSTVAALNTFTPVDADFENMSDLNLFNDNKNLLSIVADPQNASNSVLKFHATGGNWGGAFTKADNYDNFVMTTKIFWSSESSGNGHFAINSRVISDQNGYLGCELTTWGTKFGVVNNGANSSGYLGFGLISNKWMDLKLIVNGSKAKLYLDGVLKATYAGEIPLNINGAIGLNSWTDGNVVVYMDDLKIFNLAEEDRTFTEIDADFEDLTDLDLFNDEKNLLSIVSDPQNASNNVLKFHATGGNWGGASTKADNYENFLLTTKILWSSESSGSGNFSINSRLITGQKNYQSCELSTWKSRFGVVTNEGISSGYLDFALTADRWMELKLVVKSNTARVYLDGVLKATYEGDIPFNVTGAIGLNSWTDGNVVVYMDDLKVYNLGEEDKTFTEVNADFENVSDLDLFNDEKNLLSIVADPQNASNNVLKFHATGSNWGGAFTKANNYDDFELTTKIFWSSESGGSGNFAINSRVITGKKDYLTSELSTWMSQFGIYTNDGISSGYLDYALTADTWMDLKLIVNGNKAKIYLDGVLKATYEGVIPLNITGAIALNSWTNGDVIVYLDDLKIVNLQPKIYMEKSGEDFIVGIKDWNDTHKYQIWTYQKTESDIFGGEGETNQWVLSHPYTLGSDRSADGFTVDGDAITRNIGSFLSVDNKYTVAVKIIDGSGNFVGQYKDTYTPEGIGEVIISKVTVDGVFADDKAFVKDIANDSPVAFVVTGNGVAGTVYTAVVDQTNNELIASGAGQNEFSWDISVMQPGNYSVTLTASTATSTDTRTVNFKLYKNDPAVVYGELTGLVVTGAAENDNFKIDINPTVTGGKFRYRISEPWRGIIAGGDSGLMNIPAGEVSNTSIPKTAYGVYEVQTFTYRNGVSSADDGAVRTVTNARPGGSGTLNVTVGGTPAGTELITKAKGTAIVFTPEATGILSAEYSFWRRDANGWVLIRDYANEGLTWTPNRVGLYTIQVRAKEAGGLTYELLKNIEFDITDATDQKAVVTGITINQANLNAEAMARTPILITANAESTSNDLLYKFIISNGYIHYIETAYSADPTYMWVPGKSGNYTIDVLVKNQASFGKYDAVETFTVTVN